MASKLPIVSAPKYGLLSEDIKISVKAEEFGHGTGAPVPISVMQDGKKQDDVAVADFDFLRLAANGAADPDALRRSALRDAAGDRDRLQHRQPGLHDVPARRAVAGV